MTGSNAIRIETTKLLTLYVNDLPKITLDLKFPSSKYFCDRLIAPTVISIVLVTIVN